MRACMRACVRTGVRACVVRSSIRPCVRACMRASQIGRAIPATLSLSATVRLYLRSLCLPLHLRLSVLSFSLSLYYVSRYARSQSRFVPAGVRVVPCARRTRETPSRPTHTHTRTHIHTYTYMHAHTHTYIHPRSDAFRRRPKTGILLVGGFRTTERVVRNSGAATFVARCVSLINSRPIDISIGAAKRFSSAIVAVSACGAPCRNSSSPTFASPPSLSSGTRALWW